MEFAEVALVPPDIVTVTSTIPVPAGAVTVICVPVTTTKLVAGLDPNLTFVAPVKSVPPMVTLLPPVLGPFFVVKLVTVGCGVGDFDAYIVFP